MDGKDPREVIAILRDQRHQYTERMIDDPTAQALAIFVTRGQVDMDRYIDRQSGTFRGEPRHGVAFFQTICAMCHGLDGMKINFGTVDAPEYLGAVAKTNPWEALHEIRNGHPGKDMVSMRAVDIQTQVDILSYVQTLPTRK